MGSWVPATFATLSVSVLDLTTGDRTDLLLLEPIHNFRWVMVVYDVVNGKRQEHMAGDRAAGKSRSGPARSGFSTALAREAGSDSIILLQRHATTFSLFNYDAHMYYGKR